MHALVRIDRHFQVLHGQRLAVFAERVLRKASGNPYIVCPVILLDPLHRQTDALKRTLEDPGLKRKARTQAIREREKPVQQSLAQLAAYIEREALCKSDVFTTGFRPSTEQRRPAPRTVGPPVVPVRQAVGEVRNLVSPE